MTSLAAGMPAQAGVGSPGTARAPGREPAHPAEWIGALLALAALMVLALPVMFPAAEMSIPAEDSARRPSAWRDWATTSGVGETIVSGYVGYPIFHRSNFHITRPDGTDLELKGMGWDGDAFYFPIDGGARAVHWGDRIGSMVDFMHNKAIARLGKGAHGRKPNRWEHLPVEEVDASGTLKGQPAPPRIKLTDIFDRLEFTHGHNTLLFTGLMRLGSLSPRVRPYIGAGYGFELPHVEIWPKGEVDKTNEYQYAGPAAQAVAGIEFRMAKVTYFIEYKFTYAWLSGALTGDKSWLNSNMLGDLWRQFQRWRIGEAPKYGGFSTILAAHQVVGGVGYRWERAAVPAP